MMDRNYSLTSGPAAGTGQSLRRRGMLAAVAALAVGGLAKTTATPALAGTDGDMVLGAINHSNTTTQLKSNSRSVSFYLLQQDARGSAILAQTIGSSSFASPVLEADGGNLFGVAQAGLAAATGVLAFGGAGNATGTNGGLGVSGSGGTGSHRGGASVQGSGGAGSDAANNGAGVQGSGGGANGSKGNGVLGLTYSTPNAAVSGQNSGAGVAGN